MDSKDNILVIGGNGTIGTKLVKYFLNKDINVYVIDVQNFNNLDDGIFLGYNINTFDNILVEKNITKVIHLGENLRNDDYLCTYLIINNLYEFANILRSCAKKQIHCYCGLWHPNQIDIKKDLYNNNVLAYTLFQKNNIIDLYNSLNNIHKITIPFCIDLDYPASNYWGILNRILNSFLYGNSIYINDLEYSDYVPVTVTSSGNVVKYIYNTINSKQYDLKMSYIKPEIIITTFMDILGIDKLSFEYQKEVLTLKRGNCNKHKFLKKTFEKEIDRINEFKNDR